MLCFSGTSDWWLPCKALDLAHTVPSDGIAPLHSHAHFTHSCLRSLGCYPIRCLVLVLHPSGIVISTGSCHPHRGSLAGPHQATPPLQGLLSCSAQRWCWGNVCWNEMRVCLHVSWAWLRMAPSFTKESQGSRQGRVSQRFPRLSFFSLVSCLLSPQKTKNLVNVS